MSNLSDNSVSRPPSFDEFLKAKRQAANKHEHTVKCYMEPRCKLLKVVVKRVEEPTKIDHQHTFTCYRQPMCPLLKSGSVVIGSPFKEIKVSYPAKDVEPSTDFVGVTTNVENTSKPKADSSTISAVNMPHVSDDIVVKPKRKPPSGRPSFSRGAGKKVVSSSNVQIPLKNDEPNNVPDIQIPLSKRNPKRNIFADTPSCTDNIIGNSTSVHESPSSKGPTSVGLQEGKSLSPSAVNMPPVSDDIVVKPKRKPSSGRPSFSRGAGKKVVSSSNVQIPLKNDEPNDVPDIQIPLSKRNRKRKNLADTPSCTDNIIGNSPSVHESPSSKGPTSVGLQEGKSLSPSGPRYRTRSSVSPVTKFDPTTVLKRTPLRTIMPRRAHTMKEKTVAKKLTRRRKVQQACFRTMCRPQQFVSVVETLSSEQKQVIADMGFGRILDIKCNTLHRSLIRQMVMYFDFNQSEFVFSSGLRVRIGPSDVANVLGLPIGGEKFSVVDVHKGDPVMDWDVLFDWFGPHRYADDTFKLNFMHLLCCTILDPTTKKNGTAQLMNTIRFGLLSNIGCYDWSHFVYTRLVEGMKLWREGDIDNRNSFMQGCLIFLQYFYLLNFRSIRQDIPSAITIAGWDDEKVNRRLKLENRMMKSIGNWYTPILPPTGIESSNDECKPNRQIVMQKISGVSDQVMMLQRALAEYQDILYALDLQERLERGDKYTDAAGQSMLNTIKCKESKSVFIHNDGISKTANVNMDANSIPSNQNVGKVVEPTNSHPMNTTSPAKVTFVPAEDAALRFTESSRTVHDTQYSAKDIISDVECTRRSNSSANQSNSEGTAASLKTSKPTSSKADDTTTVDRYESSAGSRCRVNKSHSVEPDVSKSRLKLKRGRRGLEDDDLTDMFEVKIASARQSKHSKRHASARKVGAKSFHKYNLITDDHEEEHTIVNSDTDDDFTVIPPAAFDEFGKPCTRVRRSRREGLSPYQAKNKWVSQTANKYKNIVKKYEIGDFLTDHDWTFAHFIFCMDIDVQDDVIVEYDGSYATREMVRCFEGRLWISNHPVDLFCKYLNTYETENMCAVDQRRNLYLPCIFSYNIWTHLGKLKSASNDTLKKYLARQFDKPMCNPAFVYNRIFIPHCIDNHWSLHVIDVQRSEILILNSSNHVPHSSNDATFTLLLRKYLAQLLCLYDVPYDICNFKETTVDCCQQLDNGWDCGVLMLKMMTSHNDGSFPSLTLSHCPIYRIELAVKLVLCHLNNVIEEVLEFFNKAYPEESSCCTLKFGDVVAAR